MLLLMTLLHPHREERLSGGGPPNHPKEPTWSSHVIASPAMAKPCAGKQEAQTPPWSLGSGIWEVRAVITVVSSKSSRTHQT